MLPPGEWSALIVGDQWTDGEDLITRCQSNTNRRNRTSTLTFEGMLPSAQSSKASMPKRS